ncbi:MAG: sigma factor [Pirellulales bacterium]
MSEHPSYPDDPHRLSQITTLWSVVHRAHGSETADAQLAKQQLLELYGTAIRRYLTGALRDEAAAEDVYQNFAVQFLQGRLASADRERGRFRSFLKTALSRTVAEHHRKRGRDRLAQHEDQAFDLVAVEAEQEAFDNSWRSTLLARAWDALGESERASGRPLFSVLRARVEKPDATSTDLAGELSKSLERTLTSTHFRVWLHRARESFAKLLIGKISQSLETADRDSIERELSELRLLDYCRPALDRYEFD